MLGQIANYCPVISCHSIVRNSTSIDSIWQAIFSARGLTIDFLAIKREPDERPEDLSQRLMAFMDYNLLRKDLGITHMGEAVTEDEELTPSLENLFVLTWLRLVHADLPKVVKQRYGTELRPCTLASIKPEISQALESLMDELQASEDARAMRAAVSELPRSKQAPPVRPRRLCPLCKCAGRPDSHFLSKCTFLPHHDKLFMARVRQGG